MTTITPIGDEALAFRAAFAAALGGMPRSTFHRHQAAGLIPPPDGRIGRRPAWKVSTIRATVARIVAAGDTGAPQTRPSHRHVESC